MTEARWLGRRFAAALVLAALTLTGAGAVPQAVHAQDPVRAQENDAFTVGFLGLSEDPRYDEDRVYARIQLRPRGDVAAAAEVAIEEAQITGRVIKVDFGLEQHRGPDVADLVAKVREWRDEKNIRFFILDLPADAVAELAAQTKADRVVFFNATAPDNRLRGEACSRHVMHTAPSHAMQMDALVQFLVSKRWTRVLLLAGPLAEDALIAAAFEKSAKKFGVKISDRRPFVLSNDPRQRDRNNVALLTAGGKDHDVVFIADSDGEFGRYVPYQTNRPRPVVGTTGLVPSWWHWSFERYGAPQLNSRFERAAGRRMVGQDWAVWVAVRALVQSVLRSRTTEFETVAAFLRSERLRIDGFKGPALNFRPWNNQLRQPILISTHNALIQRAPIEGFLHTTNTLDTLGDDEPDSACRF